MSHLIKNEILTTRGSKSIYSILKENDIISPSVEEINAPKFFILKKELILFNTLGYKKAYKVQFRGKQPSTQIYFDDEDMNVFSSDHLLLLIEREGTKWVRVDKLKKGDMLMAIDFSDDIPTVVPKTVKNIYPFGFKSVWNVIIYNSNDAYCILKNGLISK